MGNNNNPVRKTEVITSASARGGYGPGAPGHVTPGPDMKPATNVKQEPVSPGASVAPQSNAYSNLKGLSTGNGKRETQGII